MCIVVRVRTRAVALAAVGAICLLGGSATAAVAAANPGPALQQHKAVALRPLERSLLTSINAYRVQNGLAVLRLSAQLNDAARQHSDEMAADGYFDHPSANGTSFWQRIQLYYASSSRSYWSVGENLLWSSDTISAGRALRLWIASPEHKKNLLDASWRELGVSAVHVVHAPGTYHGLTVTIVTTDFGVRG